MLVNLIKFYIALNLIIIVGAFLFTSDLKYSQFYRPNLLKLLKEERKRLSRAHNYLDSLIESEFYYENAPNRKFCVGVLTVKRPSHYVIQEVSSLLYGMDNDDISKVNYIVLSTSNENEDASYLSQIVPVFNSSTSHLEAKDGKSWIVKQSKEYAELLDMCAGMNPQYIIILEDDVIATKHWLDITEERLAQIERNNDWAFLRLYRQDTFEGWGKGNMSELITYCLFGSIISFLTVGIMLRSRSKQVMVVSLVGGFVTVLVFLLIVGRQHTVPIRYGVFKSAGCCTPATLFPARLATSLANFMRKYDEKVPMDLVIDTWARHRVRLKLLMVRPSIFQHIGMQSSNPEKQPDPNYQRDTLFNEDYYYNKYKYRYSA